MNAVRILDDTVVNQIAAGEVVERPSSVVKELVENSLDAGSSEITVSISNGGKSIIEILDNGSGMSKANLMLAIERFGTSKIKSIDDLFEVGTLGFRGEALPSIASVSKMQIQTSTDGDSGVILQINGGIIRDVSDAVVPAGTRITIKSLFYNVPARKKFLKGENTEKGLVKALVSDFAVSHPSVRFRLVIDGKESKLYHVAKDFFERAGQLGLESKDCLRIDRTWTQSWGEFSLKALISHPVFAVSTAKKLRIIINGRSVRERLVLGAIKQGFGNFLKAGKYPSGVIQIQIAANQVDVNVHPQKSEVRFREPGVVFGMIAQAIRAEFEKINPKALLAFNYETEKQSNLVNESKTKSNIRSQSEITWGVFESSQSNFGNSNSSNISSNSSASQSLFANEPVDAKTSNLSLSQMRYLGQILGLYLLFEGADSLYIVDMHAAHERVQFYRLKKQYIEKGVASQALLLPETLNLPADKISVFKSIKKELHSLGIDCEVFDDDSIIIRSSPALLRNVNVLQLVKEILALPSWSDMKAPIEKKIDTTISTLACHSSIRKGRELEAEEVYKLVEDLEAAESSAFCPHGRPVLCGFNRERLEELFGRSGF